MINEDIYKSEIEKIARDVKEYKIMPAPWNSCNDKSNCNKGWMLYFVPIFINNKKMVEVWQFYKYTTDDIICAKEHHIDLEGLSLNSRKLLYIFDFSNINNLEQNNNNNVLHLNIPEEFERTIFMQNNIPEPPHAVPKKRVKKQKK